MITSQSLLAAAARVQAQRGRQGLLPPDGPLPDLILQSWARCAAAGMHTGTRTAITVVDGADLARRRDSVGLTRRLAQAELETLAPQIAGSNFLLAFADRDGVILDLLADNRFATSGAEAGIVAGSRWGESQCGTNGLGTALAAGQAVAVTGLEHYLLQLRDISCTAAPIRDAYDDIVGVLDASSYVESRQRHTLALVQMAATHIENGLLMMQMRPHLVLAVHPRLEFLGTLGAGLMAFDGEGRLLALNRRCRQWLHGLAAEPGVVFEDLFGMPFELLLAQVHRGAELRLRDVLGSTLLARCVNRPAPRGPALRPGASPMAAAAAPEEDPDVAAATARVLAAQRLKVPVLICGEPATGKSTLVRHAHASSGRRGPLVTIPCDDEAAAALAGELLALPGGAPGPANSGMIASADGGTLVFDAVDRLAPGLQLALQHFLEDHRVRSADGMGSRRVDVQVLATTTVDLADAAGRRRFRPELLEVLGTVTVQLPPLRLRSDFADLVQGMLSAMDPGASIGSEALARLQGQRWPGNLRELRTVLTRALLDQGTGVLQPAALALPAGDGEALPRSTLKRASVDIVRRELARCGGSISRTARVLGVSRTTVYRLLRQAGEADASAARRRLN